MSPVNPNRRDPNRKDKGPSKQNGVSKPNTSKKFSVDERKLKELLKKRDIVKYDLNKETGSYTVTERVYVYERPVSPPPNEPISSGYSPTSPPYSLPPFPEPLSPKRPPWDDLTNYTSEDERGVIQEEEDKVAKGEIPPMPTWGFTIDYWNDLMTDYLRRKYERRRCLARKYFKRWKYNSDLKRQTINLDILYNIQ
jgi:hypothetical protein